MKKLLTLILTAIILLSFAGCTDYIIMHKSDFDAVRKHIEEDLPTLDAFMAKLLEEGRITPIEYMEYQRRRTPYNIELAQLAKKIDQAFGSDMLGSLRNVADLSGYGKWFNLFGAGDAETAINPTIIKRLEDMERIARENKLTMAQLSRDLLEMIRLQKEDKGNKPTPKPTPEPKPQPEKPEVIPENIVLRIDEFVFDEPEKPVIFSLNKLDTNNFYVEFVVSNMPFDRPRNVFIPLFTITNADMVSEVSHPHLNGGLISLTVFGAARRPAHFIGMFNMFWISDYDRSGDVERGDDHEFEEWRVDNNTDWSKGHYIRVEFKGDGRGMVTSTVFVDGLSMGSRTAGYYNPNPQLVLPSRNYRENLKQPYGMILRDFVVGNLEGGR